MGKIRQRFFIAAILFLSGLLGGCKYALLDPKGIITADEKHIMLISLFLMLLVVLPVILLTFAFAFRYRASNKNAAYTPNWSHSFLLEVIIWSIPGIIIIVLGIITWTSSYRLDPYKPLSSDQKPLVIEAISLEWKWLFIYPEQNIATVNFVQFPVGRPIEFRITADGPMNSFLIPQLGGQIYAMAGMQTKLHLMADVIGDYQGVSANFTGDGFSDMKFTARAATPKAFDAWVKQVKHLKHGLTQLTYAALQHPSVESQIEYFSSADQQIFSNEIMKSMMPMPMKEMNDNADIIIVKTKD